MNSVVQIQRKYFPSDTRSDDQITSDYFNSPDGPAMAQQYPDFAQDAQALAQPPTPYQPTLTQDFVAGAAGGTDSLLASGQGALAAGSQFVHASGVRDYFLAKAAANEQAAAASQPSVPSASDVTDFSTGAHYFAGKAGQLAPNIGEAAITSLAGATIGGIAGGAAEPAGGEVVGAGGGALYGLLEGQAVKGLLKKYALNGVEDLTAKFGQDAAAKAIADTTQTLGRTYGTHLANTINFWAQSAGSTYNTLTKNPDVDPSTALNTAIFGGFAQAVPAQFLPSSIVKAYFGEEAVGSYFTKLYTQAAKLIPEGAAAMSMQELASIASEKYADPKTRSDAFDLSSWSADDKKRLIEASVTGGLAGLVGAPVAAVGGGKAKPESSSNPLQLNAYTGDQTAARLAQLQGIAQREANDSLTPADEDAIKAFTPEQRNAYVLEQQRAAASPATGSGVFFNPNPGDRVLDPATGKFSVVPPPSAAVPGSETVAPAAARAVANPSPTVEHPELSQVAPQKPFDFVSSAKTRDDFKQGVIKASQQLPAGTVISDPVTGETWTVKKQNFASGNQETTFESPSAASSFGVTTKKSGDVTIFGSPDGGAFGKEASFNAPPTKPPVANAPAVEAAGVSPSPVAPPAPAAVVASVPPNPLAAARARATEALSPEALEKPAAPSAPNRPVLKVEDAEGNAVVVPQEITDDILSQKTPQEMSDSLSKHESKIAALCGSDFISCDSAAGILSQALESKWIAHQTVTGKVKGESHSWVRVGDTNLDPTNQGTSKRYTVDHEFTGKAERESVTNKGAQRLAEPANLQQEVKSLAEMPIADFNKEIKTRKGGLTGDAYRLGKSVTSEEDLRHIQAAQVAAKTMADAAKVKGDFNTAIGEATRGQYFREAYEAATGTGSAGDALRKADPNFKPTIELKPETPIKETAHSVEVLPKVPNSIQIETPKGPRRITVAAHLNEKGEAELTAIKVHNDATGSYERLNVPSNARKFATLEEAGEAGFKLAQVSLGKNKPIDAPQPESKVLGEKVVKRGGPVDTQHIDFDNTTLKPGEVEPSYFKIAPSELADPKTLGDRLVSGARSDTKTDPYQNSKRVTAVRDNQSGKVFLLSTFKEKSDGSVRLADPEKVGQHSANTKLTDLLAAKTTDGNQRYEPIASLKLNEVKNRLVQEFPTEEAFDKSIGNEAESTMGNLASHAEAVEQGMNKGLVERGVNAPSPDDEQHQEEIHSESTVPDETHQDFQPEHAQALWNVFGGEDSDTLSRGRFDEIVSGELMQSRRAVAAVKAAYDSVRSAVPDLEPEKAMEVALTGIYEDLKTGYSDGREAFKESAVRRFNQATSDRSGEAAAGSDVAPPAAGERATEQQSEGEEGDSISGSKPVTNPNQLLFRAPEGTKEISDQHAALLDSIHKAAIAGGLNVNRIGQDLSGMSGEFAKRTGASYDRASRTVAQVVGTVIGKEDVVTAFHEVGEDVLATLKKSNPQLAANVLAAIDKLSDRQLGVDISSDPRIRSSNPTGLPAETLSSERLIEATAMRLEQQGFSPTASKGYAQQFVRALKDLYYNAALSIQRALFGDSFSNGNLAQRFFENKVKSFLAGDFNERASFVDMLGGGKPTQAHAASWLSNGGKLFERLGENGQPEYSHVADDSTAAVRLNNLVFRQPDQTPDQQKHAVEVRLALVNHPIDQLKEAAKSPEIEALAKEAKADPVMWMAKTLGIQDPTESRRIILNEATAIKDLPKVEINKKIDGFSGKETDGKVSESAYINNLSMMGHIGKADSEADAVIDNYQKRIAKGLQEHEEAAAGLNDMHKQAVDFNREGRGEIKKLQSDIAGKSKDLGVIAQQLKAIDPMADIRKYATQFQKLIVGKGLEGENIIDVVDKMANDPSIDFSKSAPNIRKAMMNDPGYAEFTRDTPESKAMFSAVVGLSKVNARVLANLEIRRMSNATDKAAIVKSIADLRRESGKTVSKTIQGVARNARLEERARVAYREKLANLKELNEGVAQARMVKKAAEAMYPIVTRENGKLEGKLAIGVGTTFADGSKYAVPLSKDASSESILKPRKDGAPDPEGWKIHQLQLDSTQKNVTTPEVVDQHLRMMAEFLNHRESQFDDGKLDAKDAAYQAVKRQFDEIGSNKNFSLKVEPFDRWLWTMSALPEGEKVEQAANTPEARRFAAMVRTENSETFRMTPTTERIIAKNAQYEAALLRLLPDKMTNKLQQLRDFFLNPAKKELQSHPELHEQYAGRPEALKSALYNRVMDKLLSTKSTADYVGKDREAWREALTNLLEHQRQSKEYFESNVRGEGDLSKQVLGRNVPTGHNVLTEKVKAVNIGTGKLENATRAPIGDDYTFPQRMSSKFKTMVNALCNGGWVSREEGRKSTSLAYSDFSKIAEAYTKGGAQAVHALVDKYFSHPTYGDQVRNEFLAPLAQMNTESLFQGPKQEDGVTTFPADVVKMNKAFDASKGDPVEFFSQMFASHNGKGDVGEYIQSGMQRLAALALEADRISQQNEPTGAEGTKSIRGMASDFAINSRSIEHLPGEWFDYHSFDQADSFGMMKRIAAQNAYGRNGEAGQRAVDTVLKEVRNAQARIAQEEATVRRTNPNVTAKELEKAVKTAVGGQSEYNQLTRLAQREPLIQSAVRGLSTYHRRDYTPLGTLNAFVRAWHTIGSLMINQPSSAIGLLTQTTDLNLRYGTGALLPSLRAAGNVGKDLVSSLSSAVGMQILNGGEMNDLYQNRGLADPHAVTSWRDNFQRLEGEGLGAHLMRGAQGILASTVNPLGEKNRSIPFRPLQPFDMVGASVDKNITGQMWQMANRFAGRGRDFYQANLAKFSDPTFKLSGESLGLKGGQLDTFNKFSTDMQRWGVNFDDMVRNAMQRSDGTLMTNQEAARLYSMGLSEVALRGGVANFSTAWNNNPILRSIAPLMAWSWRRMQQLGTVHLDASGQKDMKSFARAMAGLSLAAGGGLAVSALMDQYYQKLLGKERNLKPILDAPDVGQAGLGVMENLNRIGTFGMFGELGNAVLGIGQGGDNRSLSVDQRVLAVSSLQSVLQVANNWVNQGFAVDYSHVVRPLLGAVGGGALIQYQQLANNALGLDNAESRVTARINSQNYLRVVGRELGLDVRVSDGGAFTPTTISPYLSKMELAAYGNNAGDFQAAYQGALAAAKADGKDDPVGYIKSAFSSRNPLRAVFTTALSQADYQRLLANMPGSGHGDVSQAVNLFNHFSAQIGATPFAGKVEKPLPAINVRSTAPKFSLGQMRERALLSLQ